jgi:hypothetical protein
VQLIKNDEANSEVDFGVFVDIVADLLASAVMAPLENLHMRRSPEESAVAPFVCHIKANGETYRNQQLTQCESFAAIEAFVNEERGICPQSLRTLFVEFPNERVSRLTATERGYLYRNISPGGYSKYSFRINGHVYSYMDSVYHAWTRQLEKQADYRQSFPLIECIPEDLEQGQRLRVSATPRDLSFCKDIDEIIELADLVHFRNPNLAFECQVFETRLMPTLQELFISVTLFNPLFHLVFSHPYLFSLNLRIAAFKICSLDIYSAFSFAQSRLFGDDSPLKNGRNLWTATVRRDRLLEDGARILREFGPGSLQLNVVFEGEPGVEFGPTREFCELMATELSRCSLNLWRDSGLGESEFAFSEIGLFPRPDADPELFFVLGLLIAKSIARGIVLPLPLSLPFCKLLREEKVELAEVEPEYAKGIADLDALVGLPFTYPGIDNLEMIPAGGQIEVTRETADLYAECLFDFTVGKGLDRILERFQDGFYSVIERGCWETFSANEMTAIICGGAVNWTRDELEKSVHFASGYGPGAPQARMLVDVLMSLSQEERVGFIKFMSALSRLPIGGIRALQPRITVVKMPEEQENSPDQRLPKASTCSHSLILPAYSSSEVMRERLRLAITWGLEEFGMQ